VNECTVPVRNLLLIPLVWACHQAPDHDGDGSRGGLDCDDGDPGRAPGLQEVVGDGVDQDCDGSDHTTLAIREVATGRYSTDRPGAQLGWTVACGADRGGDGTGDLAATASEFGMNRIQHTFAAALPRPVRGEHAVEEVLDLRVGSNGTTAFQTLLGLVGEEHGGGLIVEHHGFDGRRRLHRMASLLTRSGRLRDATTTFGWTGGDVDHIYGQYGPSPYAGPAELTGDGLLDFALGPLVLEALPEGVVDLGEAGRLALELSEESMPWAGVENAIGDLNHDGQADLLFSSMVPPTWVVFGPIGDAPATRDGPQVAQFWPEKADLATAQTFDAEVGDVSGDGVDDLVLANMWFGADPASPPDTGVGAVHVWFGPLEAGRYTTDTADVRFIGELEGAWTGRGLTLADLDGDGTKNLVVGAPAYALCYRGSCTSSTTRSVPGT